MANEVIEGNQNGNESNQNNGTVNWVVNEDRPRKMSLPLAERVKVIQPVAEEEEAGIDVKSVMEQSNEYVRRQWIESETDENSLVKLKKRSETNAKRILTLETRWRVARDRLTSLLLKDATTRPEWELSISANDISDLTNQMIELTEELSVIDSSDEFNSTLSEKNISKLHETDATTESMRADEETNDTAILDNELAENTCVDKYENERENEVATESVDDIDVNSTNTSEDKQLNDKRDESFENAEETACATKDP